MFTVQICVWWMLALGAFEAPTGSPPLMHFANFEQNARPSTNIEDMRGAPTVCAPEMFGGRCIPPAGSARAAIEDAIDAAVAVDIAIDAVAEAWR
jgi:hypothetical protein